MDCTRNRINEKKKEIVLFFKSLGLDVRTKTKALGHQGFFRVNRIDISKDIKEERIIPTLIHEFAHYITYKKKTLCKDFNPIFLRNDEYIYDELIKVTNFVDANSTLEKLYIQKDNIKNTIKYHEKIIKNKYPDFKRNEKFKQFQKYSKNSPAKHLVKYDAIKILHWFSYKTYSIINIEQEFPDMPIEFVSYLKLKSCQRKQSSITRKINKMNKYYSSPTELFARFIEGLYIDIDKTKELAPRTYDLFKGLYDNNYYTPIENLFEIVNIKI